MEIPYTTEPRADTGLYNAKMGIWLFIASEIMLFGGLLSGYVFMRMGLPGWPAPGEVLDVPLATLNTLILITSSITMVMSWTSLKVDDFRKFRNYLVATIILGVVFLVVKSVEYNDKLGHEYYPSTSNFFAIYYVLTGVHFLHIVAGIVVMLYHLATGGRIWKRNAAQFTNRIEVTGLYWHLVDLVWIFLFPSLYLI